MQNAQQTVRHANEFNYRNGYDLGVDAELSDYKVEQAAAGDVDARWEREGRAEMYATLEIYGWEAAI